MARSVSNFPIGARWECVDKFGKHGWIALSERNKNFEVWKYGWAYGDGSGGSFDWAMSYNSAKKHHWINGKFKRVK